MVNFKPTLGKIIMSLVALLLGVGFLGGGFLLMVLVYLMFSFIDDFKSNLSYVFPVVLLVLFVVLFLKGFDPMDNHLGKFVFVVVMFFIATIFRNFSLLGKDKK